MYVATICNKWSDCNIWQQKYILTHHRTKIDLWTIFCINIHITITCWWKEEIVSVKTKYYKILYQSHLFIQFPLIEIQTIDMEYLQKFKKTHLCSFPKKDHNEVSPRQKRIRNTETVFTSQKWSEQNIDSFWSNLI